MIDPSHLKTMLLSGGGVAALATGIIAAWSYVRTAARYLVGVFIGTSILKDEAGSAAMAFAFSRAKKSPIGIRVFGGYEGYVHPKRWREAVGYEGMTSDPVLVKYGHSFALVSLLGSGGGPGGVSFGDTNRSGSVVTVRYLRWFFNIEKFTVEALEYYNSEKRQRNGDYTKKKKRRTRFKIIRFSGKGQAHTEDEKQAYSNDSSATTPATRDDSFVEQMIMAGAYRLLKWNREDLQMKPEEGQSPFTGYPFPDEVGEAIKELQCWLANEKWFRSKSIPWRRGWLLYGPPGTGKSTLVRALGMFFDMPVYIFDLTSMTNNDFVRSWEQMMSNTPCIALVEDMDAVFHGREYVGSVQQGVPHLTYDCILNCISGVKAADGVFLIVTTNHVDKMDVALGIPSANGKSTRPGRIDKAICLGLMAEPQRVLLAKHILSDYPHLVDETVKAGDGETAAQFQSRCAQLALSKFWTDTKFKNVEIMHFDSKDADDFETYFDKPVEPPGLPPPVNSYEAEETEA
jgi:hypothetical protein